MYIYEIYCSMIWYSNITFMCVCDCQGHWYSSVAAFVVFVCFCLTFAGVATLMVAIEPACAGSGG